MSFSIIFFRKLLRKRRLSALDNTLQLLFLEETRSTYKCNTGGCHACVFIRSGWPAGQVDHPLLVIKAVLLKQCVLA